MLFTYFSKSYWSDIQLQVGLCRFYTRDWKTDFKSGDVNFWEKITLKVKHIWQSYLSTWSNSWSLRHVLDNEDTEFNSSRPRQDGRHFPDDIFKCIFFNENVKISIKISLKFVPKGPINNIPSDNGLAPARRQAIIWTHDG